MSISAPILHFGRCRAHDAALLEEGRALSYAALSERLLRTAGHLRTLGIGPGERVGLRLRDSAEHLVALLALAHARAVAVPLDWRAPPADCERLIEGLELRAVLTESDVRAIAGPAAISLDAHWQRSVARAEPLCGPPAQWSDPLVISATSGSTGRPKFTVMTHAQYYFAIVGMWELMGLAGHQRFLSPLALYYSGGRNSCIAHLLRGDTVVLQSGFFVPAEFVRAVRRHGVTTAAIVPSMARQLLAEAGGAALLPELTALFCSGAPLHAEEKRRAARLLTGGFHERYGTAETLGISILRPAEFTDRAHSVGLPHSMAQVQVADEADEPLPPGAEGRLRVRAPGMGVPLPGNAAEASFKDGWFLPGEIARLDEAGYIFLLGRSSDVIMRSGTKVHPAEVEAVLGAHPGVVDAAVVGRLGADGEDEVLAFVVLRDGVDMGELVGHCRARLTPTKVPRQLKALGTLPRNAAGKLDRAALLSQADDPPNTA